ncbi:MAG TPA: alpha/beta fold hydrolase [Fontimonas sp.]
MREDILEVPGAALRFRLTGTPGELPPVVLENGWGASYDYFSLLQDELAPHVQVLSYNRAGIGDSVARAPQSAEGVSRQLVALLDALGIRTPVVVAGQSYGGLMCGVHAALIPERLRAVVQIDPTPERGDPQVDASLQMVHGLTRVLIPMAVLRIPEPLFTPQMKEISATDRARLRRHAFGNAGSLRAARTELDLLPDIRAVCARPNRVPRLVISAGKTETVGNRLLRKLIPQERALALLDIMQREHRLNVERAVEGSQWITLPYTHGGLVITRAGAAATAACMLDYLRQMPASWPSA